mmetsp:Transcript_7898/g.19905  ORF Transcript_7898/g.19905 Transcript_7898/m.19905 type:complete len:234 (+) Transcript_7898:75-776(+)|eukprot:CAMPEP_0174246110 /NCGR_PEP_ID=MMETSP0417-20130205/41907_1 /TAXON_ID=242541 /ORGANISM="Mayorella sp, Strain BSH-02190019" /LENGTH=233 /DNA_ID=CAMNT_0015325961 /DNA_START=59 /DNA_END=760 /DNA_ORIENTATION=+
MFSLSRAVSLRSLLSRCSSRHSVTARPSSSSWTASSQAGLAPFSVSSVRSFSLYSSTNLASSLRAHSPLSQCVCSSCVMKQQIANFATSTPVLETDLETGKRIKVSTGIVGLPVVPNGPEVLTYLYKLTLKELQVLPEGIAYRTMIEKTTRARLEILKQHGTDWQTIEAEINDGQIEELIAMAESELELIPEYARERCWEVPEGHTVEIEEFSFDRKFITSDEPAVHQIREDA